MRLLCCAFVFAWIAFSADASGVQRTPADDPAVTPLQLRPFASKDQTRRWRPTANPRFPRGGVCLENMACACSEPRDVEGTCHGTTSCESSVAGEYCAYLCNDPMYCMTKNADECADSQPCNP